MERVHCPEAPHKVAISAWADRATYYSGEKLEIEIKAKCLSGCSLLNKAIVILDDTGKAVSRGAFAESDISGGLHSASATLAAPTLPGRHAYTVVSEPDEGHLPGWKLVRFTVLPEADRKTIIHAIDEKTGKALHKASVFFFDKTMGEGRPLSVETDEAGEAEAKLCSEHDYEVRIECKNYNEGGCSIESGSDLVEKTVPLLSTIYNKEVLGQPGYDPY